MASCAASDCSRPLPPSRKRWCCDTCRERQKARDQFARTHPASPKVRLALPSGATADTRFWQKTVVEATGCWRWVGARDQNGYGLFRDGGGAQVRAHRWAFERWGEPLDPGLTIDHLCRNRACVNPCHMEQVTRAENARRRYAVVA